MHLANFIGPEAVIPSLKVKTKKQLLQELAARAERLTGVQERYIFDTLLQRERQELPAPPAATDHFRADHFRTERARARSSPLHLTARLDEIDEGAQLCRSAAAFLMDNMDRQGLWLEIP